MSLLVKNEKCQAEVHLFKIQFQGIRKTAQAHTVFELS